MAEKSGIEVIEPTCSLEVKVETGQGSAKESSNTRMDGIPGSQLPETLDAIEDGINKAAGKPAKQGAPELLNGLKALDAAARTAGGYEKIGEEGGKVGASIQTGRTDDGRVKVATTLDAGTLTTSSSHTGKMEDVVAGIKAWKSAIDPSAKALDDKTVQGVVDKGYKASVEVNCR